MRSPHSLQAQRGAALLTAMIIVTLVASLAAAMVWRQYRAVQIEAAERSRSQSSLILQGALDWARLILRQDAIDNQKDPVDSLNDFWAVPVAESRVSTFLAIEGSNTDKDGPEAFLSGSIKDAQAQYNLRHLLGGAQVPELEQRVLERICQSAQTPPGTAALIINRLRQAFASNNSQAASAPSAGDASDVPLQPRNLDQLVWLGLSQDTIERLRPFVTLLPTPTPVNLNTAPREVIAALFDGMDLASAERLVQVRQGQPLKKVQDAKNFLPSSVTISSDRAEVVTSYFNVSGRMRLDERVLEERSLVWRRNLDVLVLDRQRVNLVLEAGQKKP
ncbi:general secretion pathway protein GspK [Paucibacter sp. KBW04]|uniref:type II secretion system minor pseudopilin GspK n=1 Tax=Paucibacter sp. KBW04 TaxID=2153361 RepID=UPI000F57FA9F|nr:type II secretion system minor pseudopilin GspK [Paucibacter sp. KBW04]RQO55640.1 general secretion pathway protein GspK [Paucibacter sp. KBW04]